MSNDQFHKQFLENQRLAALSVSTWTEIHAPESESIFEIGSHLPPCGSRKKWIDAICPLTEAPGYEEARWARVQERPDIVVICTTWKNREALETFRKSPEYAKYWSGLSTFGEPKETVIECTNGFLSALHQRKFVATVQVLFPYPMSAERREQVRQINGLVPQWADRVRPRGIPSMGPPSAPPISVWAAGAQARDGEPVEKLLWFHFWNGAEAEKKWKESGMRNPIVQGIMYPPIPAEQWFDEQVKALGALEWTEEHYGEFCGVPKRFNGEPTFGRFLRNGKLPAHLFRDQT
ncbi:Antibiotic biosynthesis monooxygenase [Macrophomina phaseolina MS6]|uniref:Antibiotic biosynthesis monooxygenase n=1 Tax=Macrophomina phaseolina (strain MS6) TaxID=1126212 RepID=K2RLD0_MACPH|nr:Antibiotic biosynthesis monooxygenase [Macrophomina phaseolina MS6]